MAGNDDRREEILEAIYERAYACQKSDGNCAQCMVAVLQDALPFVPRDDDLYRAASVLDATATGSGLQNCGAFTSAALIIGQMCGRERGDPSPRGSRQARRLIRKVYRKFKEEYGTVLCKDVRRGTTRNCPEVVAKAARWTAAVLWDEFGDRV